MVFAPPAMRGGGEALRRAHGLWATRGRGASYCPSRGLPQVGGITIAHQIDTCTDTYRERERERERSISISHVCVYTYIYIYIYVYIHTHTHLCTYLYNAYTHMHLRMVA